MANEPVSAFKWCMFPEGLSAPVTPCLRCVMRMSSSRLPRQSYPPVTVWMVYAREVDYRMQSDPLWTG